MNHTPVPPLYRSEAFAEDLLPDTGVAATPWPWRSLLSVLLPAVVALASSAAGLLSRSA